MPGMSTFIHEIKHLSNLKGIKIAHLNCRSIFKKLNEIDLLFNDIDFMLCTETWLDKRYTDTLVKLEGKTCFRCDRMYANDSAKKGGGVAIFVKNEWANFVSVDKTNTFSHPTMEVITLLIDRPNHRKMSISCVYRPPKSDQDGTLNALTRTVDEIITHNREIWIVGDFNWDWNRRNHEQLQRVKNMLRKNNLQQIIKGVTRPLNTGGSCIDWLITNSKFISACGITDDMISDHLPIFAIRKKSRNNHLKKRALTRSYKKFNKDAFKDLLINSSWDSYHEVTDQDELWDIMLTNITDILSVMCPLKCRSVFVNKPDWLSDDLLACMGQRNHYVKLAKECNALVYIKLSRFLRNKCNKMVNLAKGNFIRAKLQGNKKHPKRFWREINSLITTKSDTITDNRLIDPETGDLCNAGLESEVINRFYANVGSNILRTHVGVEPWDYGTVRHRNNDGIVFDEIDEFEVDLIIKKIEVGKSSGIDYINSDVLKIAFSCLLTKLTYLMNCSLRAGKFPFAWAHGTVIPIPKCGDSKLVGNWRPIALVPLPGKVMERLVHKRLLDIIMDAEILSNNQFGFIPGRSTSQAIFKLHKDLTTSINNGNLSALLFVDISKAFDSIHHDRLLNKLSMLGLDHLAVCWLSSYLTRTQATLFNSKLSNRLPVTAGVPQGSVLGPLLFTLYINDICEIVKDCNILLYADDCVLYTCHRKHDVVQTTLQRDSDNLARWCSNNLLRVNVIKTKSMLVGTRQKLAASLPLNINFNNVEIDSVLQYNYLGVIFDCELTLTYHLTEVHTRVQRKLFHLRKIRKYLNEFAALQVYKQTILPLLDYCGFLSMSGNKNNFVPLQTLQNDALRACVGYPIGYQTSRVDLHKTAKLGSVFQRWDKQLLMIMYDESRRIGNIVEPTRATRQALKLNFRQYKLHNTKYIKSPYIRGKNIWDRLPQGTQQLPCKIAFKNSIKARYAVYNESYLDPDIDT